MRHPLRDAANGVVKDLVEAAYLVGFRDGVVCTLLVVLVLGMIALWFRKEK